MATAIRLTTAPPDVEPVAHPTRPGVCLTMGTGHHTAISPVWHMGGWRMQFVALPAHAAVEIDRGDGDVFVKVIIGALSEPERRAFPPAGAVVSTALDPGTDTVVASDEGALFSVLTATASGSETVSATDQLTIRGPLAEALAWQTFEERFGRFTSFFDGLDAAMAPGFHLLDDRRSSDGDGADATGCTDGPEIGPEIAYVHVWTAGRGVDLSTHDHGNPPSPRAPAFAEVHQVLHNGTGQGAMYRTPEPGHPERDRLPMQRGDEHGPFFEVDPDTGRPVLRETGAVAYPWHGWAAGDDGSPGQRYDVVVAYEITAPYAVVASR